MSFILLVIVHRVIGNIPTGWERQADLYLVSTATSDGFFDVSPLSYYFSWCVIVWASAFITFVFARLALFQISRIMKE